MASTLSPAPWIKEIPSARYGEPTIMVCTRCERTMTKRKVVTKMTAEGYTEVNGSFEKAAQAVIDFAKKHATCMPHSQLAPERAEPRPSKHHVQAELLSPLEMKAEPASPPNPHPRRQRKTRMLAEPFRRIRTADLRVDWKSHQHMRDAMRDNARAVRLAIQREGFLGKQMHIVAAYTYKVEGRLIEMTGDNLIVQTDDGSIVEIPAYEVLQRWRRKVRDGKGKETDEEMV